MRIRDDADTQTRAVFERYVNPHTERFDKTQVVVELAKTDETEHVSRSQAKCVLAGLDKFGQVILDFRNIRTVGQAFLDEVFRVFAGAHPEAHFEVINANDNVDFMIRRGVATAQGQ